MSWDWNIAVFCRNEAPYIVRCVQTIAGAMQGRRAVLSVVVNGSTDRSADMAAETARAHRIPFVIHTIRYGDKANAINQFYHRLRQDAAFYFFADGYTTISPTAFAAMHDCLVTRPDVVAATGVAMNGRTMRLATPATLETGGKLHGQLHGLRRDFIERFVQRGLHIPIGLYYGDGLIGSMAMHDLDPLHIEWRNDRIGGCGGAGYQIPSLSPFRLHDLQRQWNRKIRQMRGRLENAAIRAIVYRDGYEGLPEYSDEMLRDFLARNDPPTVGWADRPFMRMALRRIGDFHRPDPATLLADLLCQEL
jgi:glycosyltransferase involved in cell wall biosynthesis